MNWFWVGVKHQSRYNVAAKTTPPFIIKAYFFPFKVKKQFVSRAGHQLLVMWSLPKTALYISPKKEEWSCFIIGGTFDGKKSFSILSSPKQFDSTYLRAQNRKMTKTARKMLPPNLILLFPPCMLRLLELNWHKPTNRCFFHLKKKNKSDEEFPSQSGQLFWNSGSEEWKGYLFFSFLLVQTDEATL